MIALRRWAARYRHRNAASPQMGQPICWVVDSQLDLFAAFSNLADTHQILRMFGSGYNSSPGRPALLQLWWPSDPTARRSSPVARRRIGPLKDR